MNFSINLYNTLQKEMGLNSLKLFGWEYLGMSAMKVAFMEPGMKQVLLQSSTTFRIYSLIRSKKPRKNSKVQPSRPGLLSLAN